MLRLGLAKFQIRPGLVFILCKIQKSTASKTNWYTQIKTKQVKKINFQ